MRSQSSAASPCTGCGSLGASSGSGASLDFTMRGLTRTPRLAIVATAVASCRGVTSRSPWPMDMFTVSPGYHTSPLAPAFQVLSGSKPGSASATSSAAALPKPNCATKSGSASTAIFDPRS